MTLRAQLLTLCTLLVITPAQAGFKDKFIRTLPWVGMAASSVIPLGGCIFNATMAVLLRNPQVDPKMTEWAYATLNKNNQYPPAQLPHFAISPNGQWFTHFKTIFVPADYASQGESSVLLKHEWNHVINMISLMGVALSGTYISSWGAGCIGLRKMLGKPKTAPRSIVHFIAYTTLPLTANVLLGKHVGIPYRRGQEYGADDFAIKNTDDPDDLDAAGNFFLALHKRGLDGGLIHPPNLERAETFHNAAKALREKQAQENKIKNKK